ncbi:Ferritin, heavy subunit [Halotydeus destructor]|nr:Ferritin, heavy subunit [Halotydeus destructor]
MSRYLPAILFLGLIAAVAQDETDHSGFGSTGKEVKDDPYFLDNTCVEWLQKQINQELKASLVYLNMAAYFQRNTVGRKGFYKFFLDQSQEETTHAHKLITYANLRGAPVKKFQVQNPVNAEWTTMGSAVSEAIALEKDLNREYHLMHKTADAQCQDPHLTDFLEEEFVKEQVASIASLTKLKTVLDSFGVGNEQMAEYHVDQLLMSSDGPKYFTDEL